MKDASLKQIALIAALILAVITLITLTSIHYFLHDLPWYLVFGLSVFSFVISFVVIYYLVDNFIYRRIKVLYKNIMQLKLGKTITKQQTNGDPLSEVAAYVKDYSVKKSEEIDELKKMEKYRKDFLGDVSHELKTPIFNTQGYIETLINGAIDNPKVNISYLKKASKNLDRLSNIVDNLLTISENEAGNIDLNITKFDIIKLINQSFEHQEMFADSKDIVLSLKSDTPSSKIVKADKKQIEIVLDNLINNAIKYGNENGKVKVGVYNMDNNILVEITDDGPGIEQEYLPRLFDRFFRIDKHRSRFDGGNGLGLSICKHIMEAHQQTIHVRSTIGIGTTFGITIAKG